MKANLIELLCCPDCRAPSLLRCVIEDGDGTEILSGRLECTACHMFYPIVKGIPRFVSPENYARSFGLQWNLFKRTQLDKFSGLSVSSDRFFKTTAWPSRLDGELLLDAGCGAGRFTDVALRAGARVVAIDLSDAVEANAENNHHERLDVIQADMTRLPFRDALFDRIYCLGVLQHTPDPTRSFSSLVPLLKPGGHIAIDVYAADSTRRLNFEEKLSYRLRNYTTQWDPERLMRLVRFWVPILLPIKRFLRHWLPLGRKLNMIIPIKYAWKRDWKMSNQQILEWSILDTYDCYASSIDQPQSAETVSSWFEKGGLVGRIIKSGPNGINGRGIAPLH